MFIIISFSFAQAMISNTDGSAIVATPPAAQVTPTETTPSSIIQDIPSEDSSNPSTLKIILIIGVPILIILIALVLVRKKRKKKFREFDAQPKDIGLDKLWKNAKMLKKVENAPKNSVVIVDEGKKPATIIAPEEELIRSATKKVIPQGSNYKETDETEKARIAIEKILEEANLRDKPGFDDPTRKEGSVTTYK